MAVKIYDKGLWAFKDAETPLVHDGESQAWQDSTGLVWNDELRCWQERWTPRLCLYDYGECDGSAIELKFVSSVRPSSGNMTMYFCGIASMGKIDLSKYRKMEVTVDCNYGVAWFTSVKDGEFYLEKSVPINSTPGQIVKKTIDLGEINDERYVMVGARQNTGYSVTHSAGYEKDHIRAIMTGSDGAVTSCSIYQAALS